MGWKETARRQGMARRLRDAIAELLVTAREYAETRRTEWWAMRDRYSEARPPSWSHLPPT